MDRDKALELLHEKVKNKNLINHSLSVEAIMKALAVEFNGDPDRWGLAGLLHDVDYEETKDDPSKHSLLSGDILEEHGMDPEIVSAVRAHNPYHGIQRDTLMAKALYCADPLTGLIVASALIHPSKKLENIDAEFVLKRFGEKAFARGASREAIRTCEDLGLTLEKFISIGLEAMKGIAKEIGL